MLEETHAFLKQPLRVHEGLIADFLPANAATAVDEEGAVKRHFFEIVIGAVGFELIERRIGEERERERSGFGVERLIESFDTVSAHGDDSNTGIFILLRDGREGVELLHAVTAFFPEVENDEDWLSREVFEEM